MPKFLFPRNSGRHRIAAIALFRALLTQCRAVPAIERAQRDELQNVVRNRFQQARHDQSARRLRLRFAAGYEAIDHLDAAVAGDKESKSYILELLEMAPARAKQTPPVILPKRLRDEIGKRQRREARAVEEEQPKPSLLDRPLSLEQLSGKRHVPILANANGIPFLRIKKPQPQELSRYINQRIKIRQKRHDTRHRLGQGLEVAKLEDAWDGIVAQAGGVAREEDVVRWSSEFRPALREIQARLDAEKAKNGKIAEKMQAVVDRERELYEKEKSEQAETTRKVLWLSARPETGAGREIVVDAPADGAEIGQSNG